MSQRNRRHFLCDSIHNSIECSLRRADGRRVRGAPWRIDHDTMLIKVAASCTTHLQLGEPVEVEMTCPDRRINVRGDAKVIYAIADDDGGRSYGVAFLNASDYAEQILPAFEQMFDRRGSARVSIEPDDRMQLLVEGPFDLFCVSPIDISATGIAFEAPLSLEEAIAERERIRMILHLPGAPRECRLIGRVVRRALHGEMVRYGVQFDDKATADFPAIQQLMEEFVESRMDRERARHHLRAS